MDVNSTNIKTSYGSQLPPAQYQGADAQSKKWAAATAQQTGVNFGSDVYNSAQAATSVNYTNTSSQVPSGSQYLGTYPSAHGQPQSSYAQPGASDSQYQSAYPSAHGQPQGSYAQPDASGSQYLGTYPSAHGQPQGSYAQPGAADSQYQSAYQSAYGQPQGSYAQPDASGSQYQSAYEQTPYDTSTLGATSSYSQEEFEAVTSQAMAQNFDSFDIDGSGGITGSELAAIMSHTDPSSELHSIAATAYNRLATSGAQEFTEAGLLAEMGMDTLSANSILSQYFDSFDLTGDGAIAADELQAVIDHPDIEQGFKAAAIVALDQLATSGVSSVTQADLLQGLGVDIATTNNTMASHFDAFDADGDGGINASDLQAVINDPGTDEGLKAVAIVALDQLEKSGQPNITEVGLLAELGMDNAAARSTMASNFEAFDADGDGGVNVADLKAVINNPETDPGIKAAATVALDEFQKGDVTNISQADLLKELGMDVTTANSAMASNFEVFDTDGDGGITATDLQAVIDNPETESGVKAAAIVALDRLEKNNWNDYTQAELLGGLGMDAASANSIMASNFGAYDSNGNGAINANELQSIIDDPEMDEASKAAAIVTLDQLQKSGEANLTEVGLLGELGMDVTTANSTMVSNFETFDTDGDGGITATDLQAVIDDPEMDTGLKAAATVALDRLEKNGWNDYTEVELLNGLGMDATAANQVMLSNFEAFDADGDGGITAEDLQAVIDDPEAGPELQSAAKVALNRLEKNGWNDYTQVELLNGLGMDATAANGVMLNNFDTFNSDGEGGITAADLQSVIDNPETDEVTKGAATVALHRLEKNGWNDYTQVELAKGLGIDLNAANFIMRDNYAAFEQNGTGGVRADDLQAMIDDPETDQTMKAAAIVALDHLQSSDLESYTRRQLAADTGFDRPAADQVMLDNFNAFDADGDGRLSIADVQTVIDDPNASDEMKNAARVALDDWNEIGFTGTTAKHHLNQSVNEAAQANAQGALLNEFSTFDSNGNGAVNAQDLNALIADESADPALKEAAEVLLAKMEKDGVDKYTETGLYAEYGLTSDVIQSALLNDFDGFDGNGSGEITTHNLQSIVNDPNQDSETKFLASAALALMKEKGWDEFAEHDLIQAT